MKRIIFLLAALFTCLAGVNVYAAECAYEARGIMYIPIKEAFTGLGFEVDVMPHGGMVIDMLDRSGADYAIHLGGRSISKFANGKNENYTPKENPQKIASEYFIQADTVQECLGVDFKQDTAQKTITLAFEGVSWTYPYKTTTYEAIKKGNKMNAMPEEVIKTAPEPKNGYLIDGVTYAPIRYTFESLGYEVEYDSNSSMIYLYDADFTYSVYTNAKLIARRSAETGNHSYEPDYMPKKIGDSYYLPLRVMSQVIEADISWDQNTKTAHIAKRGKDCYVKCYVYTEPEQQPSSTGRSGGSRVRTGYIFLPSGQVIIVQTH